MITARGSVVSEVLSIACRAAALRHLHYPDLSVNDLLTLHQIRAAAQSCRPSHVSCPALPRVQAAVDHLFPCDALLVTGNQCMHESVGARM